MLKLELSYHALLGLLNALEIASKTTETKNPHHKSIIDLKYQLRIYVDKLNGLTDLDYQEIGLQDFRNRIKIIED